MNGAPSFGANVVDREDVRVIERRGGLGFLREPPEPVRIRGEVGRKDLDRDFAAERGIARAIDLAHPARTERREDLAASESRPWRERHRAAEYTETAEVDSPGGFKRDAVSQLSPRSKGGDADELLVQDASVGLNHPLRCHVLRRRRDLDVSRVLLRNLGKDKHHRAGRVASPSLPRHNRVADVPKARRWQGLGPGCQRTPMRRRIRRPTSQVIARQPWHRRAVGSDNGSTARLAIDEAREECLPGRARCARALRGPPPRRADCRETSRDEARRRSAGGT